MKFAVCNEMFQDWPLERGFAFAAECGYTGIELAPFTVATYASEIPPARRAELRRQAEQAGVEICALHWLLANTEGFYVTSPDAEVRGKTSQYFGELAHLCADLGGRVLVLGSPYQRNLLPEVTRKHAVEYAVDVIGSTVPALESAGVVLAIEPLGPEWTDFIRSADEAVEIIRRLDSPQVRLHLDCKAMGSEEAPPAEIIRANRQWLVHFHANDSNGQGPGFGDLDVASALDALQEIGYDGWVSVEVFDYTPGVERLARESIENMLRWLAAT